MSKPKNKLSAQTKSRVLFEREVLIDSKNEMSVIDEDILKNLIQRKNEIAESRDKAIRSVFLLLALAIALALEFEVKISGFDLTLGARPYIIGVIACLASLSVMQTNLTMINENAYDGLIDQVIIRDAGVSFIDPDVLKSAYQQNWMIFKILRTPFNLYASDSIQTNSFGRWIYGATIKMILFAWFCFFLALYATIIWLIFTYVEYDILGWVMRIFCLYALFVGFFVQIIVQREFEVTDDLTITQGPNQAEGGPMP